MVDDPQLKKSLEDALDVLVRMEKLFQKIPRDKLLAVIDALKEIDWQPLREVIEAATHTELDMRMARMRITALTGIEAPALARDPDRTPVEPIRVRQSGMGFRSTETKPGMGRPIPPPIPTPEPRPRPSSNPTIPKPKKPF